MVHPSYSDTIRDLLVLEKEFLLHKRRYTEFGYYGDKEQDHCPIPKTKKYMACVTLSMNQED